MSTLSGGPNVIVDGYYSTYRTDTNQYLGMVKSRYEVVQNKDAFSFFDSIIDSGEAIFETAGRANANRLGDQLGFVGAGRTRLIGPAVYKARRGIETQMQKMILDTARTVRQSL